MRRIMFVFAFIFLAISLFGCKKKEELLDEHITPIEQIETNKENVTIRKETKEKKTDTIEIDGLGSVTFITSTSSSPENVQKGSLAKGDTVIVGDYKYVFCKVFDGKEFVETEDIGFSVIANEKRETYKQPYTTLFGIKVLYADYCYYQNDILTEANILPIKIKSASHCFDGCINLTDKNLSEIISVLKNIEDISYMFANCKKIEIIGFDNSSIKDMNGTFLNCVNLKTITKTPSNVMEKEDCFTGCSLLDEEMYHID